MARKIGVMGMGNVGATVAHIIVAQGLADTLVLFDEIEKKVTADTLDFQDAASLLPTHTEIINGKIEDMKDCDVIISAIGQIKKLNQSNTVERTAELKYNAPSIKSIGEKLKISGFNGILIVITNPNDVIAGLYQKYSGLSKEKVFGTGTYLDTSRMKRHVGKALNVDPRSIQGYVLGEHGNSQFTAWSTVRIMGRPFTEIAQEKQIDLKKLDQDTRFGGGQVFVGKGYTNYAIATAATNLTQIVLSDARSEVICSHYNKKLDTYISSPAIIGRHGIEATFDLPLTATEIDQFEKSAAIIKASTKDYA